MKTENDDVKKVEELLTLIPKDQFEDIVKAASKAQTADDIKAIAREFEVELSDEQATLLLRMYSEAIDLPLEYLESVSGGYDSSSYSASTGNSGGC